MKRIDRIYQLMLVILLFGLINVYATSSVKGQAFEPENLGDSVNSSYAEVNPVLSLSGDTLYFSRINSPDNRFGAEDSQDIYMTWQNEEGEWQPAKRLSDSINITRYNSLLAVLEDGSFLIQGVFNQQGTRWVRRGFSIISRDAQGQWTVPQKVDVPWFYTKNRGAVSSATMTPDKQYIFMTFSKKRGKKDLLLFISELKDSAKLKYTKPQPINAPLDDFVSVESPRYNAFQKRLYFSGVKQGETNSDMYYLRVADSGQVAAQPKKKKNKQSISWQDSVYCLSDTVNTESWESYYTPTDSAIMTYFCSNRTDLDGKGQSDIYKAMLIEVRPWSKITGRILNKRTGTLLNKDLQPVVHLNGEVSDSVIMAMDRSTFFALLPLDSLYKFTAVVPHFVSDTVTVDLRGQRFYCEEEVDITVESVPYVEVSGRLLDNLSLTPIEAKYAPIVVVDKKKVDTLKVELGKGKATYTVNLPFGKKYQLALLAKTHTTLPEEIDLTEYNEWTKVEKDLFARPKNANMVTLTGRILNTKTGQPLEPGHEVKMRVNRVISSEFEYKDKTANYKLLLPAGHDYDLVPSVKNFYNKLETVDLRRAKARSTVRRDFYVTPLEVGQSVDIENIYFETGKAVLKPQSFRSLNALVEFFREYPNVVVEIGGHTDNTGSAAFNRQLSEKRARSVAEYMIEMGIGRDRFAVKGYGPDKPKANNKTKEGRARNRRVDFTILAIE